MVSTRERRDSELSNYSVIITLVHGHKVNRSPRRLTLSPFRLQQLPANLGRATGVFERMQAQMSLRSSEFPPKVSQNGQLLSEFERTFQGF